MTESIVHTSNSRTFTRLGLEFYPTGTKVALSGLITALVILVFTIIVQVSLFRQVHIQAPLAQRASSLRNAIGQSMSLLGGWLIRGNSAERDLHAKIWPKMIIPELEALNTIVQQHGNEPLRVQVDKLSQALRNLERAQHLLAEIAHTPGRNPAKVSYELHISPQLEFMLQVTQQALTNPGAVPISSAHQERILHTQNAVLDLDRALVNVLKNPNKFNIQRLRQARQYALRLEKRWSEADLNSPVLEGLYASFARIKAYDLTIEQLMQQLVSSESDGLVLHYQQDLVPALRAVEDIADHLTMTQSNTMMRSGRRLAQWSSAVVLLALIMGILSAASLYSSLRAGYQMQRIAAKAHKLGQYAIESRLGGGAVGEVYRAQHALLRRPTAIKLLRPSDALDVRAQDRFRTEVQLTSQLTHPNTIDIFDYGRTPDGIFFYAMELLEGVNLRNLVRHTGPVPPGRLIHIIQQVCGSLNEAHKKGLLHRDIKPSNIMLAERGGIFDTVKVLDFGLVQRVGKRGQSSAIEGTPMYLAPEVILDHKTYSPQSDIYALGAVMYFLLTQTVLFPIEDLSKLLEAHVETPIEPPSIRAGRPIPDDIEAIIMCCLAKKPSERPASIEHLSALLSQCSNPSWTTQDAYKWWKDYGESLKSLQTTSQSMIASDVRSGLRATRTAI